jgi:hypothetical protein
LGNVAWVVEGKDINQCRSYMKTCARRAMQLAKMNTVHFDIAKTESVLFLKKRNHLGNKVKIRIQVDKNNLIAFNSKLTKWLGMWINRRLNCQHHYEVVMAKVQKAQGRVKGITGRLGFRPENANKVQIAAVQSVALYGSELWWDGQIGCKQELQRLINELARRVTGMFKSTLIVPVLKEAGLRLAISLLNNWSRRCAK